MPDPQRIARTVTGLRELRSGPVLVREALARGITAGQLRAAVADGALVPLRRGVVVPRSDWESVDERQRCLWALRAVTETVHGAFGSHDTAALLWGLPDYRLDVRGDPPTTHVTVASAARRLGWVRIHGQDTPTVQVDALDGLPITTVVRTSIDCAARRSFRTALVFMDAAMRRRVAIDHSGEALRHAVLDPEIRAALFHQWDREVAPYGRHRWVTTVRRAIRHAEPATESVLESLSRAAMIEAELPSPRCGVPVVGDDGVTYWVDFLWDGARVIGEADGRTKYTDVAVLVAEKRRQEALEARGYRFVRWGLPEVSPSPEVMVRRLRRALLSDAPATRPETS